MEEKFKVGDLIKLIDNNSVRAEVGATAIVISLSKSTGISYLNVKWVRDGLDKEQCDGGYYAHTFVLICSEPLTQNEVVGFSNICPRCTSPLVDWHSDWAKENIKKCSNPDCGWC